MTAAESKTRRIVIDPVTRIEGHAKITVHLDDHGHVAEARFHVAEFRGFEKFCEGRPYTEMAGITSRICGICPVSHLIASVKAGDEIMAVTIPPAAEKLRRLMNLAQILQSHALSFFHLSAPDLLLGFRQPAQAAKRLWCGRGSPGAGARRHPPAPIRSGDYRGPRWTQNSSGLDHPRRRTRTSQRGRMRSNPRQARRSPGDCAGRTRHLQTFAGEVQRRD